MVYRLKRNREFILILNKLFSLYESSCSLNKDIVILEETNTIWIETFQQDNGVQQELFCMDLQWYTMGTNGHKSWQQNALQHNRTFATYILCVYKLQNYLNCLTLFKIHNHKLLNIIFKASFIFIIECNVMFI